MSARRCSIRILALVLGLTLAAPQIAQARYTPSKGSNAFSVDDEIKAGRQAAEETNRKMPVLPENDPVTRYVQRLGASLTAHAPGYQWPYVFRVINQKEINAFALPVVAERERAFVQNPQQQLPQRVRSLFNLVE